MSLVTSTPWDVKWLFLKSFLESWFLAAVSRSSIGILKGEMISVKNVFVMGPADIEAMPLSRSSRIKSTIIF